MIKLKLCIVFGVLLFVLGAAAAAQASEPMNVENRITQLLSQMSLKEKIRLVGGQFLMDEKAKTITLIVRESGKEKKFLFSLSFENGKPVIKSLSTGFMPFLMKMLEKKAH